GRVFTLSLHTPHPILLIHCWLHSSILRSFTSNSSSEVHFFCCQLSVLLSTLRSPATFVIEALEESHNYLQLGFSSSLYRNWIAEAFPNHETCGRTNFAVKT